MTVITGLLLQAEYNTSETVTNLEIIIDSCVDTVNSDAGTSIGYMTGVAGAKTITVTGNEAAAIKPLIAMKLSANTVASGSSQSTGVGPFSESSSQSAGGTSTNDLLYERAIKRLRGYQFRRT